MEKRKVTFLGRFIKFKVISLDKVRPTAYIYNIATTSLFNIIDRETKELLPYSIFIITRRYKRVKIERYNGRVVA